AGTAPAPASSSSGARRSSSTTKRRRKSGPIDSVAVLPLLNVTADPDLEFLSDGLTESLINNLSPLPSLRVMARSTVLRFKGKDVDPTTVGRDLGVGAVLTGRVQQRSGRWVIGAELVRVDDGTQLWGGQLTREHSDLIALQEDIALEMTEALRPRLTVP